jgi:uncharacterized tellurite resistance protein B-like protein
MTEEERVIICRLIEAVIGADAIITPEERGFLRRVAQRFEISYDLVDEDRAPVSDPGRAATWLRGLEPHVRTRVMALLIDSAVVDGEVHPTERALLLVAAAALDIEATAVEQRLAERLARAQM